MADSFLGTNVPRNELSAERMFPGTFVPGNEWSRERQFHHGNEESWERIVLRTNVPDTPQTCRYAVYSTQLVIIKDIVCVS